MRRVILAAFFVAASVGFAVLPAGADNSSGSNTNLVLSWDFSDNLAPPAVSNGAFNIIVDVLPEHTAGIVRMVAVAPAGSGNSNLVCDFQAVQQSQVECNFSFTTNGVWTIKAQYSTDNQSPVSQSATTRLRVAN